MSRHAIYNKLPAKKEYIEIVIQVLRNGSRTQTQLINATRLTKTQTLCAVDELIGSGKIAVVESTPKKFRLAE